MLSTASHWEMNNKLIIADNTSGEVCAFSLRLSSIKIMKYYHFEIRIQIRRSKLSKVLINSFFTSISPPI